MRAAGLGVDWGPSVARGLPSRLLITVDAAAFDTGTWLGRPGQIRGSHKDLEAPTPPYNALIECRAGTPCRYTADDARAAHIPVRHTHYQAT